MHALKEKLFIALQHVVPQHLLSRLVGWVARSEIPWIKTTFINRFIQHFGVDLSEAEIGDPDRFENFNAFFTNLLSNFGNSFFKKFCRIGPGRHLLLPLFDHII